MTHLKASLFLFLFKNFVNHAFAFVIIAVYTVVLNWMKLQYCINMFVLIWNHKSYSVLFPWHLQCWVIVIVVQSGAVHCEPGDKQFFSPFVCGPRSGWKSHCLLFPLSSVVVEARRKHLQLQLLSQHDSVPCRTRRLVAIFETICLSQIWLFYGLFVH